MNIDLLKNPLEKTKTTCEVTLKNREDAELFAREWGRMTLMGHSITGSKVKVFNVTPKFMKWIESYITYYSGVNKDTPKEYADLSDEDILKELGI